MKKILIPLCVAALVVSSSTLALAASTTGSISTLSRAETHLVTLLHQFKNTATWKSQYKAALATQNAAIAALNAALAPTSTPPASGKLFSQSGSGAQTTAQFNVPSSAKGWRINWAYNCSSFGSQGNFIITVYQGTQMSLNDQGVNQLGAKGAGIEHNYDTGTFHLSVDSECAWTIAVVAGP